MNENRPTHSFFVSYNEHDTAWAEWIAWQLEEDGYTTIVQSWDFKAGSNFVLEMDGALRRADGVIAVLSPNYFESAFTPSEWSAMFAHDPRGRAGRLIPVRVDDVAVTGLFSSVVYIDLVGKDEAAAKGELLRRIKRERAKPSNTPRFPGSRMDKPLFPPQMQVEFDVVLKATVTGNDRALLEALTSHLKSISGEASLTVIRMRRGSIVLTVRCRRAGFQRLQQLYKSGELHSLLGLELVAITSSHQSGVFGPDLPERSGGFLPSGKRPSVHELIDALRNDDEHGRIAAATALGTEGVRAHHDAVPALIAALRDNSENVRVAAIKALQNIRIIARWAVPSLVDELNHDDEKVRAAVAELLGSMGTKAFKAAPALLALLKSDTPVVQIAAAGALGQLGHAASVAIRVLVAMLSDQNESLWIAITNSLANLGPFAVPDLIAALKMKDERVRAGAAIALGEIGPHAVAARPALIAIVKADESAIVRYAAAEAIRRLEPEAFDSSALPQPKV
jgi:hypothetical protein